MTRRRTLGRDINTCILAQKKKRKSTKKKLAKKTQPDRLKELKDRLPVLKFTGGFIIVTVVFFLLTNSNWFDIIRNPLLIVYTEVSSFLLNIFGMGTRASGDVLSSSAFSVNIEEGCDAVAPAILYAVSILVFPVAWKWKWKGLLYGLLAIFVLNIVRIITLFLTGIYVKSLFEIMHVEVWQAIFIVITVVIWLYWLRWATANSAADVKA